jgi:hypothetical protein
MESSYFIYTTEKQNLQIKRFHICTWEFANNSTLIEFGVEITSESLPATDQLNLILFVPWFTPECTVEDFYWNLKESSNSRFIFNDAIKGTDPLDEGQNANGVIHRFSERGKLCILPIQPAEVQHAKIPITVNLQLYNQIVTPAGETKSNIYFRFCITPEKPYVRETKAGITKSTILYDIRLNQRRNIPANLLQEILQGDLCKIETCFCFNIIPNTHDLVFFDSSILQNVRTLEYLAFQQYLGQKALEEKDLLVVFNKDQARDSYAFFSIYSKEHVGLDQLAVALLINLLAGLLLFWASVNTTVTQNNQEFTIAQLHYTFWCAVGLFVVMVLYFIFRRFNIRFKKRKKR